MNSGENASSGSAKRPRGRPPKHKTRSLVEAFKKPTQKTSSSTTSAGESAEPSANMASNRDTPDTSNNIESKILESTKATTPMMTTTTTTSTPTPTPTPTTATATIRKRTHTELKEPDDDNAINANKPVNKNIMIPQRRSSRQTTVLATQVSEGTLRPPGPPHLEAALNIAIRNLESATWAFLWAYNEKHQGKPLPKPCEIKALSKSVKRASDLADKADRELEEAIDEIMISNAKRKRRGPILSKYVVDRLFDTDSSVSPTPVIRGTPDY